MFLYKTYFLCVLTRLSDAPGWSTLHTEKADRNTLKMVHALIRHGDRTSNIDYTFSNYSYTDIPFYPYGVGQLTNNGMQRQYMVGELLRNKYDTFLGRMYKPGIIEAISTNKDRTKASLSLVLAALFPPKSTILEWNTRLNWLPIPFTTISDKDNLLIMSIAYCQSYIKEYNRFLNLPKGLRIQKKYSELFRYMSKHTGKTFDSLFQAYGMYFTLESESDYGLELPSWATSTFLKYIKMAAIDYYMVSSATTLLKKLSGGFLLKKIVSEIRAKINGNHSPKMFIYLGHEFNLVYLLQALEVYFPHIPPYGAYILLEVHEVEGEYGIRIYYQDYSTTEPKALIIPGCDYFCPFKQFLMLIKKNIPGDNINCGK